MSDSFNLRVFEEAQFFCFTFFKIKSKKAFKQGAGRKCAFAQNFYFAQKLKLKLGEKIFSDKNKIQSDTFKLYQFESYFLFLNLNKRKKS